MIAVVRYAFFLKSNQFGIIHLYSFSTFASILVYLMVHNKLAMRFLYSLVSNIIISIYISILTIVLGIRYMNLSNVCFLIEDYYKTISIEKKEYESKEILISCDFQKFVYFIWIINEVFIIFKKLISSFLAFRAHMIIKEQIKQFLKARKVMM